MPKSLHPARVFNEDPDCSVKCRICGAEKTARQMTQHLGSQHRGTGGIDGYCATYGENTSTDFWVYRPSAGPSMTKSADDTSSSSTGTLESELTRRLTKVEKKFYQEYSQQIFQQIDRDVAQWPMVMSVTLDQIQLKKLRNEQSSDTYADPKKTQALAFAVKTTEERIRAQMESLGISRAAKLKNKAQIKSTPFSLVSGYLIEIERYTPQQAEAAVSEELKLFTTIEERISKFYLSVAPDIEEEEEDDESLSSLDIDRVLAKSGLEI